MVIIPYKSFGPLKVGHTSREECEQLLGLPIQARANRKGILELHYDQYIIRFDPSSHTVRECTLLPRANATIDGIQVTWNKSFLRRLFEKDGSPMNAYGFIVFNRLGIAVTGIHDDDESQLAITAFSEGDFDLLLKESVPFDSSNV